MVIIWVVVAVDVVKERVVTDGAAVEETSVDETGPIVGEVVGRTSEEVVEETGQTVVKVETVKVVTGFVV
jgi:hypothetical protein